MDLCNDHEYLDRESETSSGDHEAEDIRSNRDRCRNGQQQDFRKNFPHFLEKGKVQRQIQNQDPGRITGISGVLEKLYPIAKKQLQDWAGESSVTLVLYDDTGKKLIG